MVPAYGYTQVSAGDVTTCALKSSDSSLVCWGVDLTGGFGSVLIGPYTQVSVGGAYACALNPDRSLSCWGDQYLGRTQPPGGTWWSQVSVGGNHTCALDENNLVVNCWGAGQNTQPDGINYGQSIPPPALFLQVSAGSLHTCGIRADVGPVDGAGPPLCWGANFYGQSTPIGGPFTQISAGNGHTCGLTPTGSLSCWGLGRVDWYDEFQRGQSRPPAGRYTKVSAGGEHTCALKTDRSLNCWGDNSYGQVNGIPTPDPAIAFRAGPFIDVSAGDRHTCALGADGSVSCWGSNQSGQQAPPQVPTTHVLPVARFIAPVSAPEGSDFFLTLAGAIVPGFPDATAFTYAFDCGSGTGYGGFGSIVFVGCPTTENGMRIVRGTVRDQDGDVQEYVDTVTVMNVRPIIASVSRTPAGPLMLGSAGRVSTVVRVVFFDPARIADQQYATSIECGDGTQATMYVNGRYENAVGVCTYDRADVGVRILRITVRDKDGALSAPVVRDLRVIFPWRGFFAPILNPPLMNVANAGQLIPLSFSIGDYGLAIFASGYPRSVTVVCPTTASAVETERIDQQALVPGGSLTYDPATGRYTYLWTTDQKWAGCRQLIMKLVDGTTHTATFRFQ